MDAVGRMVLTYVRSVPGVWRRNPKMCREVQRLQDGGTGDMLPFKGQEKAKKLVKETEKEQRGSRKVRMLGEERVANRGDSGRANKRSSVTREGAGHFWKGRFREA